MSGTSSHSHHYHQHASGPKRTRSETPTCPEEGCDQDHHVDTRCEHVHNDEINAQEKPRQLGSNSFRGAKVGVKEVQGKRQLGGGGGSIRDGKDSPQRKKQTSSLSATESHTVRKVETARTHITPQSGDSVAVGGRPGTPQKEGQQIVSKRCGADVIELETECRGVFGSNGSDAEDEIDGDASARRSIGSQSLPPETISVTTKDCLSSIEIERGEEEERKDSDNAKGSRTHARRDEESREILFEKESEVENKNKNFPADKSTGGDDHVIKKAPRTSSRQQHNPYAPVVKTPTAANGGKGAARFGTEMVVEDLPKSSAPVALGAAALGGGYHAGDMYLADYPRKRREHEHTSYVTRDDGSIFIEQCRPPPAYMYYPEQSYHKEGPPPHYYNSLLSSNNNNNYGNTYMYDSNRGVSLHSDNGIGMSSYPQPHRLSAADVRSWYRTEQQNANTDILAAPRRSKENGLGLVHVDHQDTDDAQGASSSGFAGLGRRRPPPILSTHHHRAEEDDRRGGGGNQTASRRTLTKNVRLARHDREYANIDVISVGPPVQMTDDATRRGRVHDSKNEATTINTRTNVDDNQALPPCAKASKSDDVNCDEDDTMPEVEVATEETPTSQGKRRGEVEQKPQEQFGPYHLRGGGRPTSIRSFGRRPREECAEDYRTIEEEEGGNPFLRPPPEILYRQRLGGPTAFPSAVEEDEEEAFYDDNFFDNEEEGRGDQYDTKRNSYMPPPHLSLPPGSRWHPPFASLPTTRRMMDTVHFRGTHHADYRGLDIPPPPPRGYSVPLPADYAHTSRRPSYDDTSRGYMYMRGGGDRRGEGTLYTTVNGGGDPLVPPYYLPHAYPPHHRRWGGDPSWSEYEWKREAVRWSSIAKQHEEQIADLKRHNAELAHENNELRGALAASRRSYTELETSYAKKLDLARLQTAAPHTSKTTGQPQGEQQQRRCGHHHPTSGTSLSGIDHCSLSPNRQSSPPAHVPPPEVVVGTSESAAAASSSQLPALATPTAWESITAVVVHPLTHSKRFYCEVCNVLVNSEVSLKAHLEGDKHRKGQYRLQYRNRNAATNAQNNNDNTGISINEDGTNSKHGASSAGSALLSSSASVAQDASPPLTTLSAAAAAVIVRDAH